MVPNPSCSFQQCTSIIAEGRGAIKWQAHLCGRPVVHTTSEGLREAFEAIGPVVDAEIVTDRETGRSRGFGFVEMETTRWLMPLSSSSTAPTWTDGR